MSHEERPLQGAQYEQDLAERTALHFNMELLRTPFRRSRVPVQRAKAVVKRHPVATIIAAALTALGLGFIVRRFGRNP